MRWLGLARRSLDIALDHAGERRAFGAPLLEQGMVQALVADSVIDIEASRGLIRTCAEVLDAGGRGTHESVGRQGLRVRGVGRVVDRSLQICGGLGASDDLPLARYAREVRAFRIYDGPSETHRWSIARARGAPSPARAVNAHRSTSSTRRRRRPRCRCRRSSCCGRSRRWLDGQGLGTGRARARRASATGHSNATFLLEPRRRAHGAAPAAAAAAAAVGTRHAARGARAGRAAGPRRACRELLAVCADDGVLGVPFYVMEELHGRRRHRPSCPRPSRSGDARRRAGARSRRRARRAACRRRRERRASATSAGPAATSSGRCAASPRSGSTTRRARCRSSRSSPAGCAPSCRHSRWAGVVHGDYRLGNVMLEPADRRVQALLDWELATLGDPLADLGYLVATYSDARLAADRPRAVAGDPRGGLSRRAPSWSSATRERSGRDVGELAWYEALALWKAAVFCEGLYGRSLRGETADAWTASLADGVPGLLRAAAAAAERA